MIQKPLKHISAVAEDTALDKATNCYLLEQSGEEGKTYLPMQLTQGYPVPDWRTVAWYTSNLKLLAWRSCLCWAELPGKDIKKKKL